MWTFIHRPRNTGADPVKLSGPTGRFYTLFQGRKRKLRCAISLCELPRTLLQTFRAARFRSWIVQLGRRPTALTSNPEKCAMEFSLKTCVILLVLAATQLSCGGGGSSGSNAAPPSSSPVPKMSHVFLVVEE